MKKTGEKELIWFMQLRVINIKSLPPLVRPASV